MGKGIISVPFPTINGAIKSRRMGRTGYVTCMGKLKKTYTPFEWENLKGREQSGGLRFNWIIILK